MSKTKVEKQVKDAEFDFSIKCKREDASNGFLDLKKENTMRTSETILDYAKNEIEVAELSNYELDQCFKLRLSLTAEADKAESKEVELATMLFNITKKIEKKVESSAMNIVGIEYWKPIDAEAMIKKFNKDCITVFVEQLPTFRVGQKVILRIWETEEYWAEEEEQKTLDENLSGDQAP